MPRKCLRYLQIGLVQGNRWQFAIDDPELVKAVNASRRPKLEWMYEHYALPLASNGIGKAHIMLTRSSRLPAPEVTPLVPEDRPGEGMVEAFEFFDLAHFQTLDTYHQDLFLLERFHEALLRCAATFGWDAAPFERARSRIIADEFKFSFLWKRPVASPDRRTKVQCFIDATGPGQIQLVFFDRQMQERRRTLLCTAVDGVGVVENALYQVTWVDPRTVRVMQKNGRDYWLCRVDGEPEFHFPRAEQGDAHGEYQLGRMYLSGGYVRADRERGLELIRSAAAQGYPHAVQFLVRDAAATESDNSRRGRPS